MQDKVREGIEGEMCHMNVLQHHDHWYDGVQQYGISTFTWCSDVVNLNLPAWWLLLNHFMLKLNDSQFFLICANTEKIHEYEGN